MARELKPLISHKRLSRRLALVRESQCRKMVPLARVERALPCGKRILNPSRLPIPPQGLSQPEPCEKRGLYPRRSPRQREVLPFAWQVPIDRHLLHGEGRAPGMVVMFADFDMVADG